MQIVTRRKSTQFLQRPGRDEEQLLQGLHVARFLFFHLLEQIRKLWRYPPAAKRAVDGRKNPDTDG